MQKQTVFYVWLPVVTARSRTQWPFDPTPEARRLSAVHVFRRAVFTWRLSDDWCVGRTQSLWKRHVMEEILQDGSSTYFSKEVSECLFFHPVTSSSSSSSDSTGVKRPKLLLFYALRCLLQDNKVKESKSKVPQRPLSLWWCSARQIELKWCQFKTV